MAFCGQDVPEKQVDDQKTSNCDLTSRLANVLKSPRKMKLGMRSYETILHGFAQCIVLIIMVHLSFGFPDCLCFKRYQSRIHNSSLPSSDPTTYSEARMAKTSALPKQNAMLLCYQLSLSFQLTL